MRGPRGGAIAANRAGLCQDQLRGIVVQGRIAAAFRFFSWEKSSKNYEKPGVSWDLLGLGLEFGAFHGILLGFNKISVFYGM